MTRADDALAVLLGDDWTPPPAKPAPPPQHFAHERVVRRSIDGDDADLTPRLPGYRGFLAAMAASFDWGTPIRSSSDPERFGKGALRGGGGRPHDPHTGREHYALAERELARIEASLRPVVKRGTTYSPADQMALWDRVAGRGQLARRNIRGAIGPRRKPKPGALASPPIKPVYVPERRTVMASEAALELRVSGAFLTPHEVGIICRRITMLVRQAFEARGWIHASKREARGDEEGEAMAAPAGYNLDGWKEILPLIGMTEATARERMKRDDDPLPLTPWCGRVIAVKHELEAWIAREATRERARRKSA